MKDLPITMIPEGWMEKTGGYAKDMTLRDHFAALAMQGFLAADPDCEWDAEALAITAYEQADAMIKAGQ